MKTIKIYCVGCRKNTENKNSSVRKNKQNKLILLSIVLFVARKN